MLGTIVEKVQSLFSRSFLLGNVFPFLIIAGINAAIAWAGLPGGLAALRGAFSSEPASLSTTVTELACVLTIGAFIVVPLIPVFRSALEGALLPVSWQMRLRDHCAKRNAELRQGRDAYARRWKDLERQVPLWIDRLRDKRTSPGNRTSSGPDLLTAAQNAYEALQRQIKERAGAPNDVALPDEALILKAVETLTAALESYPMSSAANGYNQQTFDRLDQLHDGLARLLRTLPDIAYRALQRLSGECARRFVDDDPRPTVLANARAAIEAYPRAAYQVDFDFIWPRLRLVFQKDSPIATAVETASAQLDFSILMTVLVAATIFIWLPVLTFVGDSLIVYLVVGLAGPWLVSFFYELVKAAQIAFGEAATMAIDGLRFDLLRALHLPLPLNLDAERDLWRDLQFALYSQGDGGFFYKHSKS